MCSSKMAAQYSIAEPTNASITGYQHLFESFQYPMCVLVISNIWLCPSVVNIPTAGWSWATPKCPKTISRSTPSGRVMMGHVEPSFYCTYLYIVLNNIQHKRQFKMVYGLGRCYNNKHYNHQPSFVEYIPSLDPMISLWHWLPGLLKIQKANWKMVIEIVKFSHEKWWFFHSYVNVYQKVS